MWAEVSWSPPVLALVTTSSFGAGSASSFQPFFVSTPSFVTMPLPMSTQPFGPKYFSIGDSRFGFEPPPQFVWWLWNTHWKPLPFTPLSPYSSTVVNVS